MLWRGAGSHIYIYIYITCNKWGEGGEPMTTTLESASGSSDPYVYNFGRIQSST